ncbi:MAG: urea transporter [Lentimicrobium sp.]
MSEPAGLLSKVYTSTVNSYTMVFFSKNPWFGLLLMVVSFFDIYAGAAGLLSLITANALAWGLGLNRRNILSGFYGFNPLLTGLGASDFRFSRALSFTCC